jgi:tRNA G18 (ribose-2'-O)-methylase SpoU
MRGFAAIGVWHPKSSANIGTLWRSAHLFDAAIIFTVGARYHKQASDTTNASRHLPLLHFRDVDDLVDHLPHSCPLVGIELDPCARSLIGYGHPERAAYLLGAEDHGLPQPVIARCHSVIQIPSVRDESMNVAVAGSLVLYDRHVKGAERRTWPLTAVPA